MSEPFELPPDTTAPIRPWPRPRSGIPAWAIWGGVGAGVLVLVLVAAVIGFLVGDTRRPAARAGSPAAMETRDPNAATFGDLVVSGAKQYELEERQRREKEKAKK